MNQQEFSWNQNAVLPTDDVGLGSLAEARSWLASQIQDKGADCPCCGKWARIYGRHLNSAMARGLIWLTQRSGPEREWVDIQQGPSWLLRTKQLPTTRHWGLIEQKINDDSTKRDSGIWRPTLKGVEFVHGRWRIQSPAMIFDTRTIGYGDRSLTIVEALGIKFNYEELMKKGCA